MQWLLPPSPRNLIMLKTIVHDCISRGGCSPTSKQCRYSITTGNHEVERIAELRIPPGQDSSEDP